MSQEKLRVLVVEDSSVVRRLICSALESEQDIEVVTAANGLIALERLAKSVPDIVTLDIEMPQMDGLATLREIRKQHKRLPVVMFSTLTTRGAKATIEALSLGATDYVAKPERLGSPAEGIEYIRKELIAKIRALTARLIRPVHETPRPVLDRSVARPLPPRGAGEKADVIVIGISTGGPQALMDVLPQLPATFRTPVVIVQHMPPLFTQFFAERLGKLCQLPVGEAEADMELRGGRILIAPGGFHARLRKVDGRVHIALDQGPPVNYCRPAADTLFESAAKVFGPKCLGVVMTGMGCDGLAGAEYIVRAGGRVIVQDEASSVVWGMPGSVVRSGLADKVLALKDLVPEMLARTGAAREPAST